ncbi:exodeoxyribonuclease VII large subunit [Paracoccus aminophilus]|uniref:Exodeoxyribonuclease 7 large subunit n=1 Tax=Paracoccus aminophilus JCM 7686 TaxID=1367847 RepID=S5XN34_PARAH|nr:exodeoxyribonuclease VII large subunit [Paracoccus aminophilus]AGT08704.1 exodeoxyribonuclease VII, large subunit [Paracoccus aminophilus JCM 7686]
MELFDDEPENTETASNAHEFTVSEISGAVKRSIEDQFGRVRVRGEVGRVSRPASGHLYFDLKDDRSVLNAVTWKGQAARLITRPEEGLEVIATGKLTTFPGQSKYQMIVDQIEPAGAGALMMMLEKRKKALAAEGLFDESRKRPLPYLPEVIAVVTSPSGAVIRDILHRLRDRFPSRVLLWPVAVQGQDCAPQVTAAIRGLNALEKGGPIPRPDLIIVARGGGSLEDLWGFNEESVVRAAAESQIPLISAVGHETDTTLIDYASDRRAPTPTAAAEIAVPVRADLALRLGEMHSRMGRAARARIEHPGQRLRDLSRALGRPQSLTDPARQRFDLFAGRLEPALRQFTRTRRERLNALGLPVALLRSFTRSGTQRLAALTQKLAPATKRGLTLRQERIQRLGQSLTNSRARLLGEASRGLTRNRDTFEKLTTRLDAAMTRSLQPRRERLDRLDRLRQTLGYRETLKRGFAVVHGPKGLLTSVETARQTPAFEIEFHDGRLPAQPASPPEPAPAKPRKKKSDGQQSLF